MICKPILTIIKIEKLNREQYSFQMILTLLYTRGYSLFSRLKRLCVFCQRLWALTYSFVQLAPSLKLQTLAATLSASALIVLSLISTFRKSFDFKINRKNSES